MKAAVHKRYGPPSVLSVEEIETPEPKKNEVLIKVAYSSVNRTDDGFLQAKPFIVRLFSGILRPKAQTLGCEFSGKVAAIGSDVKKFKVTDRVFGFDDVTFGGQGEFMTLREDKMITTIPKGADYKTAAISTEGAHYALFYIYRMNIKKGTRVFVNGATGAIGSAGVQLLKARGAYVCATSTTKGIDAVKKLGADVVIDWQKTDIASHEQHYDVFFDSVGKSSFNVARKLLNPGGIYLSSELGTYAQNPLLSIINPVQRIFTKRNIAFPIPKNRQKELQEIKRRLADKSFTPLVDRVYPLNDIAQAYEYVESGRKHGNVVIKVS